MLFTIVIELYGLKLMLRTLLKFMDAFQFLSGK